MRKFNKQEIFNDVVEHLFRQGGPALKTVGEGFRCVYRTDPVNLSKSRACGIGGTIPDERYKPSLDQEDGGMAASHNDVLRAMGLRTRLGWRNRSWLTDLQVAVHDIIAVTDDGALVSDAAFIAALPAAVRTFAEEHRLAVPAVVPAE